jgi:hypothetical protein
VFCCFRVGTDKVISWIQCVVQVHFGWSSYDCFVIFRQTLTRKEFAFEKWHDWDNDLFDNIIL